MLYRLLSARQQNDSLKVKILKIAYVFFRCDSEANLTPEERKELLAIQAIADSQIYSGNFDLRGTVFNAQERVSYVLILERIDISILISYINNARFDNVHFSLRQQ